MNLKALIEKRSALITELETLANKAVAETRAFNEVEQKEYNDKKAEVESLSETIRSIKETRSDGIPDEPVSNDREKAETRSFENYLRTGAAMETRSDVDMTTTDNGAVIPASIANKIIEKITAICPVFELATKYNVGGTLNIPYYDESTQRITMAYSDEFSDLESTSGKFLSVQLTGFLAGALTKISKSLINNSNFDIVNFVIKQIAKAAKKWIEKELLKGTVNKVTGLSGATQIVTAASATAVTADELIELQDKIPDELQGAAVWMMSVATRSAIRKLKDGDGNYLLNKDATSKWGYTLFGKPVYASENISDMASGNTAVYYGDFSGLAVKQSEAVSVEVLREKFATQHAVGVVAWLEIDSKIENQQMLAVLKMAV